MRTGERLERSRMSSDPHVALTVALAIGAGWTMCFSGLSKNLLEPKRRKRICPACGRSIVGRVCDAH
jgi:hypothetical protein